MSTIRGNIIWAVCYLGSAALILLVTTVTWALYERESRRVEVDKLRSVVQADIETIAHALETEIMHQASALDALAALVSIDPDLERGDFKAYSRRTFLRSAAFELVALAPELKVSDVFPIEGNQTVIGLDYRTNPSQLAAVERAVDAKEVVVAGPVDLVQGGQALIARKAVYTTDFGAFSERLWGIVSLVLNPEVIFSEAGLDDADLKFALRGKDGLGQEGGMILGEPVVFTEDPVSVDIALPFGSWYLAAVPQQGWAISGVTFVNARLGFAFAALLIIALVWGGMRLVQLKMRSDKQLKSAMNSIEDGFAYYGADDRLVHCNDKYRELYALSAEAMVPGATFAEIIKFGIQQGQYPEAAGKEEEYLAERLAIHREGGVNLEQQISGGRWLKIRESRTPDGGSVGFRVDITELKNARDAAEAANRAKSEFLDVMSHELRTPLTVVLGGTPFLCKPELLPAATKLFNSLEARGADTAEIKTEVEALLGSLKSLASKVDRSAKHLLTLINDVLDFSKIEAGRMDLRPDVLSLGDLVEDLVDEYSLKADAKSLYLENDIDEVFVEADELRLRQVLINIIGNAIKFTDQGGIRISSDDTGARVVVSVTDTGCGIPEDRLDDVFNKFSQVDSSSARKAGGTGLGMAISKKIVEMHGGTISVESKLGQGTTFRFTLDRAQPNASADSVTDEVVLSA